MRDDIEAVIFDADGVAIEFEGIFSEWFAQQQGISVDELRPFFQHEFKACLKGEADLKEVVTPYLPAWNWKGSVDAFLKEWFEVQNRPNSVVLSTVKQLRGKGIKCYLATNQEKYRSHFIAETMGFLKLFDHCFFSYEMRRVKPQTEYYSYVWDSIQYLDFIDDKSTVLFWDDRERNVEAAKEFGFIGLHFTSIKDFVSQMSQ